MNLGLIDDVQKETQNGGLTIIGTQRSNNKQCAHSVKGTGLNEHGDDRFGRSTDSTYPYGSTSVPGVQDEPDDYHEGEENVE